MARRPPSAPPTSRKMTAEEMRRGITRIKRRLEMVESFDPEAIDVNDTEKSTRPLETAISNALGETFGEGTVEYNRFVGAMYFHYPLNMFEPTPRGEIIKGLKSCRQASIDLLNSAISLLEERLEDESDVKHSAGSPQVAAAELSQRVFVVHGHDEGPREAVARFLQLLGLQPVILHDQPNRGRTIISKFHDEAHNVGFAVVLMTPDDEPGTEKGNRRARQNVVFELGFFLGKLGPSRVAAIVKDQVEVPSDYDGVVYIPYSEWKFPLARELRAAGYQVDLNKVF
ncbi:TIR domain-containing protein [Rhizobium leguminosarum]|uniref:TIR domain-containing protein n=1 Tax=Rhizobium leguminosarum TaxID=384 RepID=UPI001C979295|nr:nucleotide-binding protein [Rhizobium leguminosarum]MBY5327646.1 nucleotide-binding protein [Rhizobium leguminosarum]